MATIFLLDLGAFPDDGQGDPLRTGGQDINNSLTNLNLDKTERGGYAGTSQDLFNSIASLTNQLNNPVNQVRFNPVAPLPYEEGRLFYDNEKKSLSYYTDILNVEANLGRELLIRVFNDTGAALTNGTVVRATGANSDVITVAGTQANTVTGTIVSGIVTDDIADQAIGYITRIGEVNGDFSAFNVGDVLYLSDTTVGALTNVQPTLTVPLAIVVKGGINGRIQFSVRPLIREQAIAQAVNSAAETQSFSTTADPLGVFNPVNNISQNVTITSPGPGRALFTISSEPRFSGLYKTQFNITANSADNRLYTFELYLNGTASGLKCELDFSNNAIDNGSSSFSLIIPTALSPGDTLEIYGQSDSNGASDLEIILATFAIELIQP